jgi:hypothetical protein
MTKAVYIIGAAGVGKSTFTAALLDRLSVDLGDLTDLHGKPNAAGNIVTLRGHHLYEKGDIQRGYTGIYLGVMRDQFPGSDGLDRASSPTGEEWLKMNDGTHLPNMIVAEGATLATRRFMYALNECTDLLVINLECDPVVHDLRILARGAGQASSFVQSTVTKTSNLVRDLLVQAAPVLTVQADDPGDWESALLQAEEHISG